MENRLIKVAKRLASLWKASRQLRVGFWRVCCRPTPPITSATIC